MNNGILKQIIRKISSEERHILTRKLVEDKEFGPQDKADIISQIVSLTQVETYCDIRVDYLSKESIESFISEVGIANVCRFFGNLCSQYHMGQPENLSKGRGINSFDLEFYGNIERVPLTTKSGDPVDRLNRNIGISNLSTSLSESEYRTIHDKFEEASNIIGECIDNKSDNELPRYDNMDANQVRASLHYLVDRGMTLIDTVCENKYVSSNNPKSR